MRKLPNTTERLIRFFSFMVGSSPPVIGNEPANNGHVILTLNIFAEKSARAESFF